MEQMLFIVVYYNWWTVYRQLLQTFASRCRAG